MILQSVWWGYAQDGSQYRVGGGAPSMAFSKLSKDLSVY